MASGDVVHVVMDRFRNILQGLQGSISVTKEDLSDVCCPLPFSLQDLCLLVVLNDLDWYQVKLLASLPQWLRHRLLSILPALDLCRLEHTPLATGVDVDIIWNSRWPSLMAGLGNFFQLNVSIKLWRHFLH